MTKKLATLHRRAVRPLAVLGAAWLAMATPAQAAVVYTVTDLGSLGGQAFALSINASGQATGYSGSGVNTHAVRWSNGITTDLGSFGGSSYGMGINNAGAVVGYSYTASGNYRAFVSDGATMTDLGTLGGSSSMANDINNAGQIVGRIRMNNGDARAFVIANGVMTALATKGGYDDSALAISDTGQIAGVRGSSTGGYQAVAWIDGNLIDLGTFGGANSVANDINDEGQIVGRSSSGSVSRAFLFSKGVITELAGFGGNVNAGNGINSLGQVVGISSYSTGGYSAFLWSNGIMSDLNKLIEPGSGWSLHQSTSINDAGQIVGTGYRIGSAEMRAFRLDPIAAGVPEPVTWAMMTFGFGAIGGAMRRGRLRARVQLA